MRAILCTLGCVLLAGCGTPKSARPSQVPARVAGATTLGPVDGDEPVTFVLAMQLRDRARLEALVARGVVVSPDAFADNFAPAPDDYAHLVATLRAHDLDVFDSATRTTVTVRGRAADIEEALGTRLTRFADLNGTFRAPGELLLRAGIDELVAGAAGLDDAGRWWSHRVDVPPRAVPQGASGSIEPADLKTLYDLPANLGDGETIAILGTGLPPTNDDVDGYVTKFTLPVNRAQQYSQVFVGGPNRDALGLAQNEYGENILDVDMALAVAPHAKVVHVLTATNSPGLFSDGIVYIVNQVAQAHQVSVSYGTCERVAAGEMLVMNQLFLQAKAEGQQWFFASGDNGTDGCRDGKGNKVLSVNWPASSPYVLSVGGTEIVAPPVETAWSAGGGGQSEILDKPPFQIAQAGDTRARTPSDGVRDEPDIAAIGGVPGVAIYGQGMLFAGVEGTSVATPIWAGVWALLDEAKGHAGFSNGAERLYQLGATGASGLRDITLAGNGDGTTPGYPAKPGWDYATGWGVPDVAVLVGQW
jgi:kumamolisin